MQVEEEAIIVPLSILLVTLSFGDFGFVVSLFDLCFNWFGLKRQEKRRKEKKETNSWFGLQLTSEVKKGLLKFGTGLAWGTIVLLSCLRALSLPLPDKVSAQNFNLCCIHMAVNFQLLLYHFCGFSLFAVSLVHHLLLFDLVPKRI